MSRFSTVFIAFAILIATAQIDAKPDKEPSKAPKAKTMPAVPNLTMQSNYGAITHDPDDNRKITISGHQKWEATGTIRADGSVFVVWTHGSEGRRAPGLYRLIDGELIGHWQWGEFVEICDDGEIKGLTNRERIYRVVSGPDL